MAILSLIKEGKKSTFVKIYLRVLPTLIGLSVISAFLLTRPQLAEELFGQLLTKLHLRSATTTSLQINLVNPINDFRLKNNLKSLIINDNLNQVARLAALSIADDPDNEDAVNLKQLASLANYRYESIAYLAAINPLPLVQPPTSLWITDSKEDLLSTGYTHIGSYYLKVNLNDQDQVISIIVLGRPQSNSASIPQKTQRPSYYTGVELWTELQKYRVEHGVPEFKQDNTLCTIASIRVNQLIDLGRLDNHDGFEPLVKQFRDDDRITHSHVAENILSGFPTAKEAVAGWDGSLGHQALMRDGSYVFACAAANYGYAVLIAAF